MNPNWFTWLYVGKNESKSIIRPIKILIEFGSTNGSLFHKGVPNFFWTSSNYAFHNHRPN